MAEFNIVVDYDGNIGIINLRGELYSQDVPGFNQTVVTALEKTNRIVLDIIGLEYICSAAMGSMLSNFNHAKASGGEIVIARMNEDVKKVFEFIGFSKFMKFFDSLEEAKDWFKK